MPLPNHSATAPCVGHGIRAHFNLEVVLRGDGFSLVKFRQPNDADKIVYLDTWVGI
jgi:hypothetical protein